MKLGQEMFAVVADDGTIETAGGDSLNETEHGAGCDMTWIRAKYPNLNFRIARVKLVEVEERKYHG